MVVAINILLTLSLAALAVTMLRAWRDARKKFEGRLPSARFPAERDE
jgi:hypothetical protein